MDTIPDEVLTVARNILKDSGEPLAPVTRALVNTEDANHPRMWKAVKGRSNGDDDLWVWAFLNAAKTASEPPPYQRMTKREREALSDRVSAACNALVSELRRNGLDFHIFHSEGKMFRGYFAFEDFGDSNRRCIEDDAAIDLIAASKIVDEISFRTRTLLEGCGATGKRGRNADAIHFARHLATRNLACYGTSLLGVVATATNSLFETTYTEQAISGLLNRGGMQS